jgi:hypothetical protein
MRLQHFPVTYGVKQMSSGPQFGGGDFFGNAGPRGPFGAYPSCGCSSIFIILAGILLVFGGCLRMVGQ